jgi:hypothetical protein
LGSINSKRAKFKQALEQEWANQKAVEEFLTLIEKLLVLAKRRVKWLEEQNESLTETMQKQHLELQWSIEESGCYNKILEEV